ncbi:MAG: metalloregulator ArsR/SmtB family transcription factor [Candidatus Sumerlaeaceae bacterium]|nr:metalloregulator ArsR/SmtB family transcription factor [Candidatus Sumerlaeaceae bacterium]
MKAKPSPEMIDRIAALLAALGEPTRLRILMRLREGPATVGDLASELAVAQPSASKHLAVLRQAGLVEVRREGTRTVCSVSDREVFNICEIVCGCVIRNGQREMRALGLRAAPSRGAPGRQK